MFNKKPKENKKAQAPKPTTIRKETKVVNDLNGAQAWMDRVSPSALEFKRDSFVLEQAYCAIYSIFNYPSEVGIKWLKPITEMENTMVSIVCEEGDKAEIIKSIDYSIREQQIKQAETADSKVTAAVDASDKIDKSIALSQRILSDNVNVTKVTIYIMVYANGEQELQKFCKDIEGRLSGYRFTVRRFPYLQEDGFDSMNPVCANKYVNYTSLTMPSDVFFAGMGFIPSFGINDPSGLYLGFDESANPIFLDIWSKANGRTNSNLAIMGKSGSGKSATTKTIMVHELAAGSRLFVLDPEEEYLSLAENFGGNIIEASGGLDKNGQKSMINPLQLTDFPKEWDDMNPSQIAELGRNPNFQGSVSKKIQTLKGWFKIYQPDLTMAHLSLLEKALYETYSRKGLTEISDPRKLSNDQHPTMSDLGNVLEELSEKQPSGSQEKRLYNEILIYLQSALVGSDRFLFNGHTNVDINNKFNVFNVHSLLNAPDNIKNAQFDNITSFIWLALTKDRNECSILAVDEAHMFISEKSKTTFEFLGELCKRARKYNSSLWVTTQNIGDFLHPSVARYGEGILNNCSIKMLMKTEGTDLQKLSNLFLLNEGEESLLKSAPRGQGLLMAGDMRVFASVQIEPGILKLCQAGGGK